jgi:hypothetical protein
MKGLLTKKKENKEKRKQTRIHIHENYIRTRRIFDSFLQKRK